MWNRHNQQRGKLWQSSQREGFIVAVSRTSYTLRHPTHLDLPAVAALLAVVTATEFGEPDFPEAELREHWDAFSLESDTWLIIAPDGAIAAYAAMHHGDDMVFQAEGYVHPDHVRLGIGGWLIELAEKRAHDLMTLAPPGTQVLLYNAVNARNQAALHLLEDSGYVPVRFFWRMVADLTPPLAPPACPGGIDVRTWESAKDDHDVFTTIEEAFQDHWAHSPAVFDVWRRKDADFDPGLWFLAYDGAECAGALLARHHLGMGWVEQLGVRRAWRGRGIGLTLLHHAFAGFAQRGWARAGLDVDAESETGASRLYERAGMRSVPGHGTTVCRKELRSGSAYDVHAIRDSG